MIRRWRGPNLGARYFALPSQLARTNFIIAVGRILDWIRAPETPGPTGPSTSTGPVV
jgi:hypothetical protein